MSPPAAFTPLHAADSAVNDPWVGPWARSLELAVVCDLAGRVIAVNSAFGRKFGRRSAEWPGLAVADLVHPDDFADWQAAAARVQRPPYHIAREHRWHTAQGWRWLQWEETLLHDAEGQPAALRSIGRDVTKHRLAEEHFSKLAQAVDQSPVSIVMTTPGGRVQYVNPRFTQVTGYTLEEVFEQDLRVLREGHPGEAAYRAFCETVAAGRQWRGELRTRRKDGSSVWEAVTVAPIRSQTGEITHLLCLREDITERKRLEDQLRQAQKMESLGTLAGGIAHDFNNLIAIIKGFAEIALARCATGDELQQKYLREVHGAAQRAAGLVRQILTFSRKTEVSYRPVDLNELIGELVGMLAATFPRTIEFRSELEDTLPAFAADPNQLQQVIMNLCVNARDAMPDGGVLTLRTRRVPGAALEALHGDPQHDYAAVSVGDTGCGIPLEVRSRIFEPFFTTKQGHGGTGLGLAVVYGIVLNHHGLLDVESAPGEGTTFHVYLPLAARAAGGPVPEPSRSQTFPPGKEDILIVEDEPSLRDLLGTVLRACGYRVHAVSDGAEAASFILGNPQVIDAVLLDLNLPRIHGIEILKTIRQSRPGARVIVLSGNLTPESRQELRALGQTEFLDKPYDLEVLAGRLRAVLDGEVDEEAGA
ncbi:MAG TPA: PAS domain S-box protein [Opitutaceae bacterium]